MTDVLQADWYDKVMVEDGSPAMLPLEESPWREMYQAVAAMIAPHEEVVDLGCGTGRMILMLRLNGEYRGITGKGHYARITGVDWSASALGEAALYNRFGDCKPEFVCQDLADWQPDPERAGNTVYVCTEVLEHLEDDLGLVRRIPPGHRFLFSVPNFHSESHLRVFTSVGDLWGRYDGLLTFRSWRLVEKTERHGIHVVETVRRTDAW